jgi:hypothetical protein
MRAIFGPHRFFFSPFLSKHNHETQNNLPTHPNNRKLLTGTIPQHVVEEVCGVVVAVGTF